MQRPAAREGDQITATDTHIVLVSTPAGETPTPVEFPFKGALRENLSPNVKINGRAAVFIGSVAHNDPPHLPVQGRFQTQPSNRGEVIAGSDKVFINGKPAVRDGDAAMTCNDPADQPIGRVESNSNVLIG